MGTGYTRNDTPNNIADGNVINASDLDGEFDAIQAAFNATTGHSHDGTTGEGPQIDTAGIANDAVTLGTKTSGNYVAAGAVSGVGLSGSASSEGATFTVTSNATSANTASTIVARDASGNFSAGQITGTSFVTTGDMTFGDNDKAIFGAGSDLQIYHDGSHSYIKDAGDGDLILQGSDDVKIQTASGTNLAVFTEGTYARLFYNGTARFETTNTGVDVTGTLSANNIRVGVALDSWGANSHVLQMGDAATDTGALAWNTVSGADYFDLMYQSYFDGTNYKYATAAAASRISQRNGSITFDRKAAGTADATFTWDNSLNIASNGDISFYDSTGTTQGFFWDASTQRLGLGTTSPVADLTINKDTDTKIQIISSNGGTNRIVFGDQADQSRGDIKYDHANEALTFSTNNMIEAVRIDSSGNVGININAPSYALDVKGIGSYNSASFRGQGASIPTYLYSDSTYWAFGDAPSYGGNLWGGHATNNELYAYTNGSERFRIDSSGNLLVGTTSTSIANTGLRFSGASNYLAVTRASAAPLILNLTTSDGDIAQFRKDNTAVGSIGAKNGDIFISGTAANSGIRFYDTNPALTACSTDGSDADAALSLGVGSVRFKDLHLSGQANVGTAVAATQTASVTGSTTLDFSTYQNFILTMTGNITLANPTTEQAGQTGFMILIHSGAARTVSLGTDYETAGAAGLTLSGTSGAVDLVPYVVQSSGNILLGTPQLAFS